MEHQRFKYAVGEIVKVSPAITGTDKEVIGRITDIEYYMDYTYITVSFLKPHTLKGESGIVCLDIHITPTQL